MYALKYTLKFLLYVLSRDIGICKHMNLVETHKRSVSVMGSPIYKVVSTKLINVCCMVWDLI